MKQLDKLVSKFKTIYKNNKKWIFFFVGIFLIGIISGSLFTCYLSKNDQVMVKNYITNFISTVQNNQLDYFTCLKNTLLTNLIFIITIWILGMSIIGIPINLISYFGKSFILGFSLSSLILTYQSKGIVYLICYIFPHHLINFIIYLILMIFSLKFSVALLDSIFHKREINFKNIIGKYIKVLCISVITIIATAVLETYFTPVLFQKISIFIK